MLRARRRHRDGDGDVATLAREGEPLALSEGLALRCAVCNVKRWSQLWPCGSAFSCAYWNTGETSGVYWFEEYVGSEPWWSGMEAALCSWPAYEPMYSPPAALPYESRLSSAVTPYNMFPSTADVDETDD